MKKVQTRGEIEFMFERRRYGTGASTRFFTWLLFRKAGEQEWETFGDPWPKVVLSKKELNGALDAIEQGRTA